MKKIYIIVLLICSIRSLHAQSWNITGNSGLTTSNFLGSTDNHNVIFKANNAEFGRIAATGFWRFGDAVNFARIDTSGKLTFGGNGAYQFAGNKYVFQYSGNLNQGLFFNSDSVRYEFRNASAVPVFTVNANTGNSVFNGTLKIGAYTLPSIDGTSGQVLTTNGSGAVSWSNVSGSSRVNTSLSNLAATTAINAALLPKTNNSISLGSTGSGWTNIYIDSALYIGGTKFLTCNTSSYNTGVGLYTLSANTTGAYNTATGFQSLHANTTGYLNMANGYEALAYNTTGNENTANGASALYSNNTGSYNTANGSAALAFNTTGVDNTANGAYALYSNTTGTYNTANGDSALFSNTTGSDNTANGGRALYANTTGYANTAVGENSQPNTTTGWQNTSIGTNSLTTNITGSFNTAVGYNTNNNGNTRFNTTCIGIDATATGDDMVRIGNVYVTSIGGQVGWSTLSDGRFKENIKENVPGLSFINLLRPVTYNLNRQKVDDYTGITEREQQLAKNNPQQKFLSGSTYSAVTTGFIAQEVEQASKEINYDFSGVDAPKNDKDMYGLRYADFVVPLVKAVQELSSQNDSLKNDNVSLRKDLDDLKNIVRSIQQQQQSCGCSASVAAGSVQQYNAALSNAASLEQNMPNPFTNTTTIGYTLPQKFSSAQIIISDKNGKVLKQLMLSAAGKGSVHVDAAMLASGAYSYALYVNGKFIDSKQMVLAK
jgi:hypothetical protein